MGKRYVLVILAFLLVLGSTGCKGGGTETVQEPSAVTVTPAPVSQQGFYFSETGYFYSEDTSVQIISGKPGRIYYTMDGSDPDEQQTLYKEPIQLIANSDTRANVIKAKAYYEDGTESDTIIHTYFVGKNVKERFDTLIFSVTTDPYNLYDYEYGIFVEGKLRDDYIALHPGVEVDPDDPANFNIRGMEGEREVYLEVFEPDGTRVIAQNAGIRTYGGWSRAREQKSIKIFARKEYDAENKKLKYSFFPERTSVNGEVIDSFKRLVLRNCGNDNGFAFIRDELFQTLAAQAGYSDYEAVRPSAMFVNGEYRGFFWLHEVYCDEYFEDHYGKYDGSFEILEGGETYKNADSDGDNAEIVKDYEEMYHTYVTKDLTDNTNYEALCKVLDVENYLSYYAYNIYLGNEDWPHNNYRTYRYYAAEGEGYGEAPFDGKWRYLLHDMDFSTGIYSTGAYVDNIQQYIGENGEVQSASPLFGLLMQREDCREIFIKKTLDLINGVFEPSHFNSVLDEMNASRSNELQHTYGKNLIEDWVSSDDLSGRIDELKNYIFQRDEHILEKYQQYFRLGGIYTLSVIPADGCQVKINSFTTDSIFAGSYYEDYATTVTAVLPKGKKLDYWLVNGDKATQEELTVTAGMIKDNKVDIEMVVK
jgi:hypothetical protein